MSRGLEQIWPDLGLRAGVVPFRSTAAFGTEILLIRRPAHRFWSLPKGHLMADHEPHVSAAIEAYEEAGVRGRVHPVPLGNYRHVKSPSDFSAGAEVVEVILFPLEVQAISEQWPEMNLRERRWIRQDEVSEWVAPGQLHEILAAFVPSTASECA